MCDRTSAKVRAIQSAQCDLHSIACFVPFSYAGTKQSTPFRRLSWALSIMDMKYQHYRETLEELLEILGSHSEEGWCNYFSESLSYLNNGAPQKSIVHSLGAYGGMGSFNDELSFTGAPIDVAQRGFELRDILWTQCKINKSLLRRIIEA